MESIYNYTEDMLKKYWISKGEKSFRAPQTIEWLYRHQITSLMKSPI